MTSVSHRRYRIVDTDFSLRFSPPGIAHQLDHLLCGFHTSGAPQTALHYTFSEEPGHACVLHTPEGESCQYPNIQRALPELEIEMIHRGLASMPYIGLHAGAIRWHGKTVLFPGASGRGKTTLSLGCALMGAHFLSDEIAVLDPASGCVRAFPRTLCVKNQSLSLFDRVDPDRRLATAGSRLSILGTECIRVDVLETVSPDTWHPIDAVVCLNFTPNDQTRLLCMRMTEAVSRLLQVAMNRSRFPNQSFNSLTELATSVPCFSLSTGNLQEAITHIQTLCRETL